MPQYEDAYMYQQLEATFETQFIKTLSNTEAESKKNATYKKQHVP